MWGLSVQFWQSVVSWANLAGLIFGAIAVVTVFISAFVSAKISDVIQEDANRRIEASQLRSDEAKAEAEKAKEGAARANENAAQANLRAVGIEKQNLELREKIANRRITLKQHKVLVEELSKHPSKFNMELMGDPESGLFAADILKTFTDAGWQIDKKEFKLGVVWIGLILFKTDDSAILTIASALKNAGIPFMIGDEKRSKATIMIGGRPPIF